MKVKVLTGYFPAFQAKHLTEQQFRDYGALLEDATDGNIRVFGSGYQLRDCWAHRYLEAIPDLRPSDPHPALDRFATPHDMVCSNIAILQRFTWLQVAAAAEPDVDQWVWLEYTIMKQPNVTAPVIKKFIQDVALTPHAKVSLPGCWDKAPVNDNAICWRFVGSCWVCPGVLASTFAQAAKTVIDLRTRHTGTISWDVNTLAFLELLDVIPMRWYRGNHDATQLTNYIGEHNE
jgi:hypothetical protein